MFATVVSLPVLLSIIIIVLLLVVLFSFLGRRRF